MSDLMTQLHEYGRQLDEVAEPLAALAPDPGPVRPSHGAPSPGNGQGRRWLAFAGAFVLVSAAVGIAAWLMRESEAPTGPADEPVPTINPTTPSTEAPAVVEAPPTPALGSGWRRLDAPGGQLAASTDLGLVVVTPTEPEVGPSVWHSFDGVAWTRAEGLTFDPDSYIVDVEAGGPGFVAVGNGQGGYSGLVWTSADGRTWQAVADPELPGAPCGAFHGVKANRDAVVAFGCGSGGGSVAVMSIDGRSWESASLPGNHRFGLAAAAGDMGFVAFGGGDQYFSADGFEWTRTPSSEPEGAQVPAIAEDGRLLLAGAVDGEPAVWASADLGQSWKRMTMTFEPRFPTDEPAVVGDLIPTPFGYVGVGWFETMSEEEFEENPTLARSFIIHSWDGVDWTALLVEDAPAFTTLHATEDAIYGTFYGIDHWAWSPPGS